MKKVFAGVVALGMLLTIAVPSASAVTIDDLLAQIAALQAQLAALQGGGGSGCYAFSSDLTLGSQGMEVTELQDYLTGTGHFTFAGGSTGYFGPVTQSALAAWQAANGVAPAAGYWGPISRAKYNTMCVPGGDGDGDGDGDGGPLQGGAGSISDVDYVSSLNNEEVGEGEDDVEVVGLKIEADEGSDLQVVAVSLNFSQGTANRDFDKYATEVSVWMGGEELGRWDADDFTDDKNFDKTVSLDDGGIIRAGETEDLVVAVSGISNLDSGDEGETWTLEFESVRFEDASGAIITDSATGDINDGTGRTFSFESFATAVDAKLKIAEDDDDVNDAHIIEVDDSSDTNNVEILSFTLEAEGSDLDIKDFGVNIDVVSTDGHVDYIIAGSSSPAIHLILDGEEYGDASYFDDADGLQVGADEDVWWDDVNYTLEKGDKISGYITVDLLPTGEALDPGDTIQATLSETETDQLATTGLFQVEDEEGEDLVDADITGSATGEAHGLYEVGIHVELDSVTTDVTKIDTNSNDDSVLMAINYSITAFGGDVWVSESPVATTSTNAAVAAAGAAGLGDDSVLYRIDKGGTATLGSLVSAPDTYVVIQSGATDAGAANGIQIEEGETIDFTLSVSHTNTTAGDGGQYRLSLTGISWEDAAAGADEFLYTFDIDKFVTPYVLVN